MVNHYDIFDYISQREIGEMPEENERLVLVSDVIRRAEENCGRDEAESCNGNADLNEHEKRIAENWAKENNCWIPFEGIFQLGMPGPSGSESDTYSLTIT